MESDRRRDGDRWLMGLAFREEESAVKAVVPGPM